jgi:hypothetical protein
MLTIASKKTGAKRSIYRFELDINFFMGICDKVRFEKVN